MTATASAAVMTDGELHRNAAGQDGRREGRPEGDVCNDGLCITPCQDHRASSGNHNDPCVSNSCVVGMPVSAIIDCAQVYECCEGKCCPKSCDIDARCAAVDPCRRGRCGLNGKCEFTLIDSCHVCSTNEDRLYTGHNSLCFDGAWRRPSPTGTPMGKRCECQAAGTVTLDGIVVIDDASG